MSSDREGIRRGAEGQYLLEQQINGLPVRAEYTRRSGAGCISEGLT